MPVEKNFYVWLRSGLRKLSRRWPPVFEALAAAKVAYNGDNKRRKFSYRCSYCDELFDAKSVSVDHIKPAGKLQTREDIANFIENLFCEEEGLQVLCDVCHDAKSLSEKLNIPLEEAFLQKRVIEFMKQPKEIILDFLQQNGYNGNDVSNKEKRRKLVEKTMRGQCV